VKYLNRFRVLPGDKVRLKDIDPGLKDHHESHKKAAEEIEGDRDKLRALQALLYADGRCSLLICLQGLDAGGKDGTISHILGAMNPQGYKPMPTRVQKLGWVVTTRRSDVTRAMRGRARNMRTISDSSMAARPVQPSPRRK
jgi:hypothetical protein